MGGTAEVYEVQTLNNGRWTIQSRCRTEEQAVAEAHQFFDRRQCIGVKVVKEAFDEAAQLYREFTVFRLPGSTGQGAPRGKPGVDSQARLGLNGKTSANGAGPSAAASPAPRRRSLSDFLMGRRSLTPS